MMSDTPVVYSTRPVIEIDGQVQDQLGGSLLSLTITEAVAEMARLKARFENWGMANGRPEKIAGLA